MRWTWVALVLAGCSGGGGTSTDIGSSSEGQDSETPATTSPDRVSTSGPSSVTDPAPSSGSGADSEASDPTLPTDDTSGADTEPGPDCLNGVVDPGEQCDDGNDINADGCNRNCRLSGQLIWQTTRPGTFGHIDEGYEVRPLSDGTAIVVGYVAANDAGARDGWIARYDGSGELLWDQQIVGPGGVGNDEIRGLLVDDRDNIYAVGYVRNDPDMSNNGWMAKFDADGEFGWVELYNGPGSGSDVFQDAVLDLDGNLIVTGYRLTATPSTDVSVQKVSPSGSVLWTREFTGAQEGTDLGWSADVSPAGHTFVVGYVVGPPGEGANAWLAKLDTDGNEIWSRTFNGSDSLGDSLNGVAVIDNDDVVVCGFEPRAEGAWNTVVRRYNSFGMIEWTDRYEGASNDGAHCSGVAIDGDGNIVTTGGEIFGEVRDALVRKYSPTGEVLWTSVIQGGGAGFNYGRSLSVDANDRIWITGAVETDADARDVWLAVMTP